MSEVRFHWLATVHPTGRPHVRPVLAVWVDAALYTTTNPAAGKGRNLERDPRCTVTARTENMDFALEGQAARVIEVAKLERVAGAYRSKYGWPVTVVGSAFDAPHGAPTAGSAPYQPYEITPSVVFGFGTDELMAPRSTRWRL